MRKKYCFVISILMIAIILSFISMPVVNAADEYSFELNYTGEVLLNETKEARVILRGTNGTTYPRVRIKVDISGPATPKLMATDTNGAEHDIAQLGYWGPDTGFAVQGTFENITPVRATFPSAGTYKITLSLINLDNNNAVITTKTETIEVLEDATNVNNDVENNDVEKLPQTGTTITEYIIYTGIILAVVTYVYCKIRKASV